MFGFYKIVFFFFLTVVSFGVISCSKNKEKTQIIEKDNKVYQNVEKLEVVFRTSDNLNIKGDYYFYQNKTELKQPLIILIHQFRSSRQQWNKDFIDSLVNNGYKVLTYDIRGHGESDKIKSDLSNLLTDKEQAPKDLDAIFKWAKIQMGIDTSRIGVAGTSIGASLALYTRYFLGAKTIIGISGGKKSFEGITGIDERTMGAGMAARRVSSVFFICGSKDNDYIKEEESILENFVMEPKQIKIFESEKHGKDLIQQYPEINGMILNWFNKYL